MFDTETQSQYASRRRSDARSLAFLTRSVAILTVSLVVFAAVPVAAQESPYIVLYDHHMEEPGNLEVSFNPVIGTPKEGNRTVASSLELEYGATGWWTTSLYLDAAASKGTSAAFTGYRFENRLRLLLDERVVNPVLYIEYANTTGADRIAKEIVGFDSWSDFAEPLADVRHERTREIETKLILSGNRRGWNIAANWIAEKNLAGRPWEFGYAVGTSRPLVLAASPTVCRFCAENFSVGVEAYGGLGEQHERTLSNTAHYIAPAIAWTLPNNVTIRVSPGWGLTSSSNRSFIRFGLTFEGRVR